MKRLIAFISILMLVSSAYGTATSVTIYGTNKSNAQTNVTCYGCNQTISVQAWNTTYVKNISVHSRNGSGGDVITFNISNVTGYQVQELKANGTSINAYQAGANGMLNFSYTVVGNRTLVLSPAVNVNGYNSTWSWFWNLTAPGFNDSDNQAYFINPSNTGTSALLAGKVVVGTMSSLDALTIRGATTPDDAIRLVVNSGGSGQTGIRIDGWANNAPLAAIRAIDVGNWNGELMFFTDGGDTTDNNLTERMRIDKNGNVGIGTDAPTQKLDVAGGINATHMNVSGSSVFAPTTQATNATLSRGQDTVYQNGYKPMFLSIVTDTTGVDRTIKTDANNPPTTIVSIIDADTPAYAFHTTAVILPRNFYMLDSTSTVTILYWTEWT